MKRLRMKPQRINTAPRLHNVLTEDDKFYYYFDECQVYKRIEKLEENRLYTITFSGGHHDYN